jgi:hypothetical protein
MSKGKTIVLTMYGKDETIESISISLFDKADSYYSDSKNTALNFCDNINELELKDNHWVYAGVVGENKKIILGKPPNFTIINKLDALSLQKVLREVSTIDLAKALLDCDEETQERVYKNMSKVSASMLKEDMASLHQTDTDGMKSSKKKVIAIIQDLSLKGQIILTESM